MNIVSKVNGVCKLLRRAGLRGLIKSIYWNFKIFPINIAIYLPLILGKRCSVSSCRRGCIEFNCESLRPGLLEFGTEYYGFQPKSGTNIRIRGTGKLIVNGRGQHWFGSNGYLSIKDGGCLEIGDNFTIGNGWCIFISDSSFIGNNCMFSWNILLLDTDCHPIINKSAKIINPPQPFVIGDNVWIGAYSTILKGSEIPSGSIIASKSSVTKKLQMRDSMYLNNDVVRTDVNWSRDEL